MPRRSPRPRRDWRVLVFVVISLIIVFTMIVAYLPIGPAPGLAP